MLPMDISPTLRFLFTFSMNGCRCTEDQSGVIFFSKGRGLVEITGTAHVVMAHVVGPGDRAGRCPSRDQGFEVDQAAVEPAGRDNTLPMIHRNK